MKEFTMRQLCLSVWLLTAICSLGIAQQTDLTPVSLLRNSHFSKGEDFPSEWTMMLSSPDVFNVKWHRDAKEGNHIIFESLGPDYSGYIMQKVPVTKGAWYRLKLRLSHSMGRGLIWVYGYDEKDKPLLFDRRKYLSSFVGNPLVPHFVRKELMNGSEDDSWRDVIFDFHNSDDKGEIQPAILRIAVGIYFTNAKMLIKSIEMWQIDESESGTK